jgi:hypothetical protein
MSVMTLEILKGKLMIGAEGEPIAYLSASRAARKAMRDWFDRLAVSCTGPLLFPRKFADGPKGFEIHYPKEPPGTTGLPAKVAEWSQDVPAAVPSILRLGRFVLDACRELARQGHGDALVAPGLIRFVPGTAEPWWLLPLPCSMATVADWSRADPETWQWLSADAVLGSSQVDPVRALGAALHHAVVGALFPETLSRREKFARVLRGRAGMRARLNAAAIAALPSTFAPDAAELERLVLDCLQPNAVRVADEEQVRGRFEELARRLSTDRLIRYWGFENKPAIVAKLAELDRIEPEALPESSQPWSDVAEERVKKGDLSGALDAAWNAIGTEGPSRARIYLSILQRMASRFPFPVSEATTAIGRVALQYGDTLEEADALRLIHLRLRYLNDPAVDLNLLNRRYESTWNHATALLIRAWLCLRAKGGYNQVSKLCKEGRKLYESMPERGGAAGVYATAYLHLLDGIAHIGAVATFSNESFYTDAFEQFARALELSTSISAEDEIRASFHWLGWLAQFTRLYPDPPLSLVYAGTEAILRSQGLTTESFSKIGVPEIPRYDEDRIFPL